MRRLAVSDETLALFFKSVLLVVGQIAVKFYFATIANHVYPFAARYIREFFGFFKGKF